MSCFVCRVERIRVCGAGCGLCADCPGDVEVADDAEQFVPADVWPSTTAEEQE